MQARKNGRKNDDDDDTDGQILEIVTGETECMYGREILKQSVLSVNIGQTIAMKCKVKNISIEFW